MKNYIILLFSLPVILTACTKGLNLLPEDSISDATFWRSPADFKEAANNLYNSLDGFNYENMDVKSDIAFFVPNSVSNGTYLITEKDSRWSDPYVYIRRCNKIILEGSKNAIEPATEVKRFVAEAKFFRAYNYWRLLELYGGVPLITDVLDLEDQKLYTTKATFTETVNFIISDLTDAANDLPLKSQLSNVDVGRITKGTANSFKARVALFGGTWLKYRGENPGDLLNEAIEAATSVMGSGQYSLFTEKGQQSYRYQFIEEGDDSRECILDRRYQRYVQSHGFGLRIEEGHLLPTKELADMYLCQDGLPIDKSTLFKGYNDYTSEFKNRDPRMSMTILIPGTSVPSAWFPNPTPSWPFFPQRLATTGYTTYKYVSENFAGNESPSDPALYDYDRHLLRYAEVLLIYAEAKYEQNGSISDEDLDKSINLLRNRVGMVPLENSFVIANNLDMKEEIRRERTVELALEGFRWDDLRRWKTAETDLPKAVKGIKLLGTPWLDPVVVEGENRNPYLDNSWLDRVDSDGFIIAEKAANRSFSSPKDYLVPIPSRQISLNPKLVQNTGW